MNILAIDSGNSRIKWAFAAEQKNQHQGAAEQGSDALAAAFAALPAPDKIIVSNVAGEAAAQRIRAACAQWNAPIEFIAAQAEQCGVRNRYEHPAQLGSDRWAALIAAWHQQRDACLVVNCGTAVTVDALSSEGEFLGGLILPGLDMMRRSLVSGTAQLSDASGVWQKFPRNTADAMHSGATQAVVGAVLAQFVLLDTPPTVYLSGGAAEELMPHFDALPGFETTRVDDLVLRGLMLIALENGGVR
jgi:type III pantothenate kinase